MALLFIDSFDHWADADRLLKWSQAVSNGNTFISSSGGRNSTNGLYLAGDAAGDGYIRKALPSTYATLVVGFAYKFDGISASGRVPLCGFDDQTVPGEQISLALDINQMKLVVILNNAVIATGTTAISAGVWYFIEMKVTIDNTTGAYDVHLDGASEITASATDTQNTANAYATAVRLGGQMGYSIFGSGSFKGIGWFDDFYVCDNSSAVNNDFLGDCRVQCLFPDGPGAHTDFVPSTGLNWQNVDDTTPDGDSTYNASIAVNNIDTYSFQDLTPTSGSVKGVQVVIDVRKDDAGTREIAPVIRQTATDYVGTTVSVQSSYAMKMQVYNVNPATAAAFTISEVNADEFGVKQIT